MMRLLFVADARSPIALNWIEYFTSAGHEVHLASTFPAQVDLRWASYTFIPVALSGLKGKPAARTGPSGGTPGVAAAASRSGRGLWGGGAVRLRTAVRQWLGPFSIGAAAQRLRRVVEHVQPDLVHAMRIPYEGMLATAAVSDLPLIVSVWGNDFTLHAPSSPLMKRLTRRTLERATAVHTDCRRDARLAREWGFSQDRSTFVLPGAGGVQRELFYPSDALPAEPLVIQPRGVRAYVQNRAFFQSIPHVIAENPEARFVCPNMAAESQARHWVAEMKLAGNVNLLPAQSRPAMGQLFRRARVVVSPTTHDGTPNTLLEALASGCLPVAGDLESIREWITPGVNGLLVDPKDPLQLAEAVLEALRNDELWLRARRINLEQIADRGDYPRVMAEAEQIYFNLISQW